MKSQNHRREFLKAASLSAVGFSLTTNAATKDMLVYIGTYTNKKSEGIYVFRLNTATGELKPASVTTHKANPSFIAIDARRRFLYAVMIGVIGRLISIILLFMFHSFYLMTTKFTTQQCH